MEAFHAHIGHFIACHGIEEGRFDATIEMTAQTVSG